MVKNSQEPIFIGVELLARKGDEILLGLRGKKAYGAGSWALPGGCLEYGERLADGLCREMLEELGANILPHELRLVSVGDDLISGDPEQHIHISFELLEPTWTPQILEPDQCDEWRYFPLDKLPGNIFKSHAQILENYREAVLYKS
ncbi:NUDIX domain-containing protein [Candidatus Saccharibacteria bacterium]|nr:NUDIX domain-containing protein [Candidatus Saccharibacteria bacterium]